MQMEVCYTTRIPYVVLWLLNYFPLSMVNLDNLHLGSIGRLSFVIESGCVWLDGKPACLY